MREAAGKVLKLNRRRSSIKLSRDR
jgi:hypothetical protein